MGTLNTTTSVGFFLPFAGLAQISDVDMAKQHFSAANGYYQRGEYEKAIEEFKKAYELSKKPELHYNIAICNEKLVKVRNAISAYKFYLAEALAAPEMINPHAPEGVKTGDENKRAPQNETKSSTPDYCGATFSNKFRTETCGTENRYV